MNLIIQTLQQYAEQRPEQVAFFGHNDEGREQSYTYLQLLQAVRQTAQQLNERNISALALRAENSLNWLIVDLAAMMANVVIVPIPMFFSPQQVAHSLEAAGITYLLGDWQSDAQQYLGEMAGLALYHRPCDGEVGYLPNTGKITFTSGSTGTPRGVCLSHEHLANVSQALANGLALTQGAHLVLLPLSTLLENITGIYVPLLLGLPSIILPGHKVGLLGSSQFDPALFAKALAHYHPATLVLTPALLMALIGVVHAKPELAHSLRFVAVGGAKVAAGLIHQAHSLGIPAFEGYGLSECGSVVCLNLPQNHQVGSCGQPLPHCQVRISDDGELLVKGNSALGYLQQTFEQEWLATGDLASIDEQGFVHLSGRKKNLIITAYGRNVCPEWLESQAQIFLPGQPFIVTGDGQQALCAIAQPSSQLAQQLISLNASLPDYARIHYLIEVEQLTTISNWFTANGKLQRQNVERDAAFLLAQQPTHFLQHPVQITELTKQPTTLPTEVPMHTFFDQLKQHTLTAQQEMLQAPVIGQVMSGAISKSLYVAFLTQAYHHVKHTVPLLMACGGRLSGQYEWVREALAEYIDEEKGHQEWILNDIRACGGDAIAVKNNLGEGKAGRAIELMVAYLYHHIDRHNPLALFGMVWVLEGTSVGIGGQMAQQIQRTLQLPSEAMSYLTSHSVLDQSHLQFFERLMNQITAPNDQQVIIDSANMVFSLYGEMLRSLDEHTQQQAA
ncbi:TPA: long-chain acyl-CoA synthetase [Vibrio vulnificus]|nr:long-chain acyl-CoA synthetase [Vibrio vulnificus]